MISPQKYILYFGIFLIISCSASDQSKIEEQNNASISGSWKLEEYIPEHGDAWLKYDDSIKYEKHLTDDHFVWFSYDTKHNALLGMGGGTYSVKNGEYTENIMYFYPPGSSALGQAIPFNVVIKDGVWNHTGYSKIMEMDPETAEIQVVDSLRIIEKWSRIDLAPNADKKLVGTWDLISYRESENGNYIEYPQFAGYMKLITPTHFTWVYFNKEQDEIYAAGSGTYVHYNETYTEAIDMIYPKNRGEIGSTVLFKTDIENNKWKHSGLITRMDDSKPNNNMVPDSFLIDEIWTTHTEID